MKIFYNIIDLRDGRSIWEGCTERYADCAEFAKWYNRALKQCKSLSFMSAGYSHNMIISTKALKKHYLIETKEAV